VTKIAHGEKKVVTFGWHWWPTGEYREPEKIKIEATDTNLADVDVAAILVNLRVV